MRRASTELWTEAAMAIFHKPARSFLTALGTVLAAMLAALRFWYDAEGRESLVDVVRRTIDLLETTLGAGPAQA